MIWKNVCAYLRAGTSKRKSKRLNELAAPVRKQVEHLYGYDIPEGIKCRLIADSRYLDIFPPLRARIDVHACKSKWIGAR